MDKLIEIRKAESGNMIVPNSFYFPNWVVDNLMRYLTPQEWKVLTFAYRQILGFQTKLSSRRDRISLSQFMSGKQSKIDPTNRLCNGCGLSLNATRRALASLTEFGILIPIGPATRDGQLWELQDDIGRINVDAIQRRVSKTKATNRSRVMGASAGKAKKAASRVASVPIV